jgi:hypothetical protein
MFSSVNQPAVSGNAGKHRYNSLLAQTARVNELKANLLADPLLPAGEVRILLNLSYSQMRKLVKSGQLPCWRSCPKGHMKFRMSTVMKFVADGFARGVNK